ncbi:VOC family protein [Nitrosovibrio tenuis]|uniref:Glyoxalase/Bleomycin resistance protein/Dioxygenase superfamily protein n=1 Tax=Nitrosovibrio tenuis TaxID=1233 RepID=A0A1H7GNW4_9PROT|nr:VOC family protein [Nitrosovibrio tenuis]SEK39749.1 Glyoxalase/Bleomycin resistance protein/Dioxygenase superfamily protein [Nitrosovibrio tenuis]
MDEKAKPHLVGINHIALEVGNIDEAVAFYARIFTFELRGRGRGAAFIDMGDQFIALMEGRSQAADDHRHFGWSLTTVRTCANLPKRQGQPC